MTFKGDIKERVRTQRILIMHAMAVDKLETQNQKPNPERDFMLMNYFIASRCVNTEMNWEEANNEMIFYLLNLNLT